MTSPRRDPIRCARLRGAGASLVWGLHVGVMVFLGIGWALPGSLVCRVYVALAPIVVLGWWIFRDACWLSIVEAWLRGERWVVRELESGSEQTRSFVAETLSHFTGRPVSHRFANGLSYGAVTGGFVVSSVRLWLA